MDREKQYKRYYPHQEHASHILGGVNIDNIGIKGIEKNYDQIAETIARGNGIFLGAIMSFYGCSEVSNDRLEKLLRKNFSKICKQMRHKTIL